jgi:hypothetical protein
VYFSAGRGRGSNNDNDDGKEGSFISLYSAFDAAEISFDKIIDIKGIKFLYKLCGWRTFIVNS